MQGPRRIPRPAKAVGWLAALLAALLLAVAYAYTVRSAAPGRRLANLLLAERFTTGRFTGQTSWQECTPIDTAAVVPRVRCGEPLRVNTRHHRRVTRAHRELGSSPVAGSSLEALRGRALVDLRTADTASAPIERAVAALEEAHRRAPDDAGVLNDLAVAYLALGERTQQFTPMLRALDAVERAAAADSADPSILFNRALILQHLYLIDSANHAWTYYLAVERDPRWRDEAQVHARWVAQVPASVSWDSLLHAPPEHVDGRTRSEILRRVAQAPQAAREFGFTLYREWAVSLLGGNSARATRLLLLADEIGRAEVQLGVDQSVQMAAQAIRRAANAGMAELIARGHIALETGIQQFSVGANAEAMERLENAELSLRAAASPMARWAKFYRAAAAVNDGDYQVGDRLLRDLLNEGVSGEPALIGKTIWASGLSQLRRGNYDIADQLYRDAEPYIAMAREAENQGALALLLAESSILAGQTPAGRKYAYDALKHLAPFRRSNFLNNHLAIVASYARREGFRYAALALTNELVDVAWNVGKATVLAQAFSARMRDLGAIGQMAAAIENKQLALSWMDSIPPGRGGNRVRAHVHLSVGQFTRTEDPDLALPLLTKAVESYTAFGSDLYLPTALYEGALAAKAIGDTARARRWLQQAVAHVEEQKAAFTSTEVRTTFYDTIENLFDEMIALELAAGRPDAAFVMLERGRISPWRTRVYEDVPEVRYTAPTPADLSASIPEDMVLVEYALLRDRLIIWTVSRHHTRHYTVQISRDSVAQLVKRSHIAPNDTYARLYDILVRSVREDLRGHRRLTVVPDRELYLLPYAALRDRPSGRHLVDEYQIRTVPSAAFFLAATSTSRHARADPRALVLGNPALDASAAGTLPPLPGAAREARSVAQIYPGSTLLTGPAAHRDTVLQLLPEHSIFHFAGHAVFNSEQPELSYLALGSDAPGESGILQSRVIGGLQLSSTEIVVLSACSSLSPRPSRTGAITGLAYSFLRAGAPATVSTLWDVDDGATTALLVAFHRHLATGTPAPEALRQAQLEALHSGRPELTDPRTWAAFIYTGP